MSTQPAPKQRSVRITITTTVQVQQHLEKLLPLGLYGNSVAEVAERLVCEALRNDMRRLRQSLLEADVK
jgi:hypothetical protein